MSGEHKRPLAAFVVVAVACMVTVVNAARSSAVEALPGWTPVAEAAATHPPGPDPFAADPPRLTQRAATTGSGGGRLTTLSADSSGWPAGTAPAQQATAGVSASKAVSWTVVLPPG